MTSDAMTIYVDGKRYEGGLEQIIRADGGWHLVVVVRDRLVRP